MTAASKTLATAADLVAADKGFEVLSGAIVGSSTRSTRR